MGMQKAMLSLLSHGQRAKTMVSPVVMLAHLQAGRVLERAWPRRCFTAADAVRARVRTPAKRAYLEIRAVAVYQGFVLGICWSCHLCICGRFCFVIVSVALQPRRCRCC